MNSRSKVSIVIPALNESAAIRQTIEAVPVKDLDKIGYDVQILVVDNASTDNTGEIARNAGADVIFEAKPGYGAALKAGFANASGDIIVTADADMTYPLEDVPALVNILQEKKLDFITTDRFSLMKEDAMSDRNKIGNAMLSLTMRVLFNLDIRDSQSGMWIFRRDILKNLVLKSNTPLSQEIKIEACHFNHCRWEEVPIVYKRRAGKAKLGGWKVGIGNMIHLFGKRLVR